MNYGRYSGVQDALETLHLDIPKAKISLNCASGYIKVDGELKHWFAKKLEEKEDNHWTGKIYKTGGLDFTNISISERSSEANQVRVLFYKHGTFVSRDYRFESKYFRELEIEIDAEEGIDAITTFNPHKHRRRHPDLPNRKLTIESVFQKNGINAIVQNNTNSATQWVDPKSWSDNELHDAMRYNWSAYEDQAQWSMWVFLAGKHEDERVMGKMFDDMGKSERQGVAIFYNSDISEPPQTDPQGDEAVMRYKFNAIFHEIGHAFNLGHLRDRRSQRLWLPFDNFRTFNSFMENVKKIRYKEFKYQFRKEELEYLRHAPEEFVKMGDHPWYDDDSGSNLKSRQDLELSIHLEKKQFDFLEPVMIELVLKNTSDKPVCIDKNVLQNNRNLAVFLKKKEKEYKFHANYVYDCMVPQPWTLTSHGQGNSLSVPYFLSASKHGWLVDENGNYKVRASLVIDDAIVRSEEVCFTVLDPVDGQEDIAGDYFSYDVGRIMAFDGSIGLKKGNDTLKKLVTEHPNTQAAIHARVALGMPYLQDFKSLTKGTHSIRYADFEEAYKELAPVFGDPNDKARNRMLIKTLGKPDFEFYVDKYKDLLGKIKA